MLFIRMKEDISPLLTCAARYSVLLEIHDHFDIDPGCQFNIANCEDALCTFQANQRSYYLLRISFGLSAGLHLHFGARSIEE